MSKRKLPRPPDPEHLSAGPVRQRSMAAGQLEGWLAAVEHLHAHGLPAAVPEFAAAWLRRRGIRPDWETAA